MGWAENFSNVVRHVLFKDDELKSLMAIPAEDAKNILAFRDKYLVRGPTTDTLVLNEKVRIVYYEGEPTETDAENIMRHRVYFDIYVRKDCAYNATNDRMLHRADLIAKRLNILLSGKKLYNIRFIGRGVFQQTSRSEGYDRFVAVFAYKRIY